MVFEEALQALRQGKKVRCPKHSSIVLRMTGKGIVHDIEVCGSIVPVTWVPDQYQIVSGVWEVVD